MIESSDVLGLMKVVYVLYVAAVFSLIGMFAFRLVRPGRVTSKGNVIFYAWVMLLIFTGVGIHILTFKKLPWVKWEMNRDRMVAEKKFDITVGDYRFRLPEERLVIKKGQTVRFSLESKDYTYGFGLFREDGTLVFQMQVVPGHKNDIVWKFDKAATYTIRSTEYSGPKGGNLMVKNAVIVAPEDVYARLVGEERRVYNE